MKSTAGLPRDDPAWRQKFARQRDEVRSSEGWGYLIAVGDSLIEQIPRALVAEVMPSVGKRFFNAGISGDSLPHVIWRVGQYELQRLKPIYVWILAGTNDIGHHRRTAEEIVALHEALWVEVERQAPQAKIIVNCLLPRVKSADHPYREIISAVNSQLRERCARVGHLFLDVHERFMDAEGGLRIDLMPDELHVNEAGYRVLLTELSKMLANITGVEIA